MIFPVDVSSVGTPLLDYCKLLCEMVLHMEYKELRN